MNPRAVTPIPLIHGRPIVAGLKPAFVWADPLPIPSNDRYPLYTQLAISVARVVGEKLKALGARSA